jgi:hypothetical protein
MKTIPVYETNVLKAFNKADKKGKELLMEMFGAEMFSQKITDRIKTFEDALEMVGCTEEMKLYLNYNGSDADLLAAQAFAKLTIIAKALNEGWKPDWTNTNEYKYYAWFKGSSGAFVFGVYSNHLLDFVCRFSARFQVSGAGHICRKTV